MMKKIFFIFLILSPFSTKSETWISLGHKCQPALAIKAHGLRTASFPLDWVVSPIDGLTKHFETKFDQYFKSIVLFRDKDQFVFPHDKEIFKTKIFKDVERKYKRRTDRFIKILESGEKLIFIRTENSFENSFQEGIEKIIKLNNAIKENFPLANYTLVVLTLGPILEEEKNLPKNINLFSLNHRFYHLKTNTKRWNDIFKSLGCNNEYNPNIIIENDYLPTDSLINE